MLQLSKIWRICCLFILSDKVVHTPKDSIFCFKGSKYKMEPYTSLKNSSWTSSCHKEQFKNSFYFSLSYITLISFIYPCILSKVFTGFWVKTQKSPFWNLWWYNRHLTTWKITAERQPWINDLDKHQEEERSKKIILGPELLEINHIWTRTGTPGTAPPFMQGEERGSPDVLLWNHDFPLISKHKLFSWT